jgi:hypothetical protein
MRIYNFDEIKAKCDAAILPYVNQKEKFERTMAKANFILKQLREEALKGSLIDSKKVSARYVNTFNICDAYPYVCILTHKLIEGEMPDNFTFAIGVCRGEVEDDYKARDYYYVPMTDDILARIKQFQDLEKELVDAESNIEFETLKASGKKEKVLSEALNLPDGFEVYVDRNAPERNVVILAHANSNVEYEGERVNIGRLIDLGKYETDDMATSVIHMVVSSMATIEKASEAYLLG